MSFLWNSESLREATGGSIAENVEVAGLAINSLEVQKGDLFIALSCGKRDGHEFIPQALAAGASAVMADNKSFLEKQNLLGKSNILLVENCLATLDSMARYARSRFQGKVIAVTGSVGKTTTKDMLFQVLSAYGQTSVSKKSLNNHLGVPLSLASLPQEADFGVLEIGMNHPGEILPLAKMVLPDMGIITAINKAHAGNMGNEAKTAKEKASLLTTLPQGGISLFPDLPAPLKTIIEQAIPQNCQKFTLGWQAGNNFQLKEAHLTPTASACVFKTANQNFDLKLSAPGKHLLENAAFALGAVLCLGLDPSQALNALSSFKPGCGRGECHQLGENILLVDQTHNASPASMKAALETLALDQKRRKIAVLGDMLELGNFSEKEHLALAEWLIKADIVLFCCGKEMKKLFQTLPQSLQGGWAISSEELIAPLTRFINAGDHIMAKGSHSMRLDKLIQALKIAFPLSPCRAQENKHHAV